MFIGLRVFSAMIFVALIRKGTVTLWDSGLVLGNIGMLTQRQYKRSTAVIISSFSFLTSNHAVLGLDLTSGWMLLAAPLSYACARAVLRAAAAFTRLMFLCVINLGLAVGFWVLPSSPVVATCGAGAQPSVLCLVLLFLIFLS